MQTITFCSFKGGTSKTSTALHLGACLAKFHGKKVLLVDFDSQANLSIGLGIGPDSESTMVSVLRDGKNIKDVIRETAVDGLYLIAANAYLDGIEKSPQLGNDLNAHIKLGRALKEVEAEFDFCFIDTPPSLGWLTQTAFFASNHSLMCAIPEAYSIIALRRLKEFHDYIQQYHKIDALGIVLSFWDERGAVNETFANEINKFFPAKMFDAKIRRDVSVSRAVLQGKPVIETDPSCRASKDYQELTIEALERLKIDSAKEKISDLKNRIVGVESNV